MATPVQQSASSARPAVVPWVGLALAIVFVVAIGLRIGEAWARPSLDWPDEVFQTTEPAHRLAFGNGAVTWEWRDGTRNWVFPGFLALIMRLTAWIGPGSSGYMRAITVLLAALSLAAVWAGYRWGSRSLDGPRAGVVVAMVCAVWYDLVYYGPKTLNEVMAAHLLIAGLYLAYWANPQSRERGRLLAAGILLGAVVGLRIQLAPAVAVAVLLLCFRLTWRRSAPLLVGSAVSFFAFGVVDTLTWSYPFGSYVRSVRVNLLEAKSVRFGVFGWDWYGYELVRHVGWLLPFSVLGARRSPFLAAVAGTVLVTHSALAHKEYRFIYPAVVLLVVIGGLGLVEVVRYLERKPQPSARAVAIVALVFVLVAIDTWRDRGNRAPHNGTLPAFQALSRDAMMCGVGLRGPWFWSGGYTYLHRDVPIVPVRLGDDSVRSPAFNVLVTTDTLPAHPAGFALDRCWGHSCVYRRPGGCTPDPAHDINAYLKAQGE